MSPWLYHELGFLCKPESGPGSRFRRILAILTARPHLYRHVRIINFHFNDNPKLAFQDLANHLEKFTGLRTVTFSSCYPEESRCLLEAMRRVPMLEDLTLRGVSATVSIQIVLQNFLLPSLKRLKLSRYGVSNSSTEIAAPDRNWNGDPPPLSLTQTELEQLLPPAQYHTGNVVSMEFEAPTASFNITEHLLRWPTQLVELSIASLWYDSPYTRGGPINTREVVQRLLSVHQQSLKRIRLGMILCGGTGMPDFSEFPNLETLSMSAYNTIQFETPSVMLQKLAAPKLQCFTIDFFAESRDLQERSNFGEEQVQWMQDFASLKQELFPSSMLDRVVIVFNPDQSPALFRSENLWWINPWRIARGSKEVNYMRHAPWPWEHLQQARECIARY
jgi:hypothetical protein